MYIEIILLFSFLYHLLLIISYHVVGLSQDQNGLIVRTLNKTLLPFRYLFTKLHSYMEEAIFNKLLVESHAFCLPKLIRLTESKADAEDAFMEAVYVLWQDLNSGKVKHKDNLKGLIYVMAKNIWLMAKRKMSRGNVKEFATDPVDLKILEGYSKSIQKEEDYNVLLKSEIEQIELHNRLQKEVAFKKAFETLSEKCRELLTKFIVEKMRLKAIQEALGFPSVDAVKMTKYRCKKNLVKVFKINFE